jgi:FlaA1/EpsC-like NDP-sugar epimerase
MRARFPDPKLNFMLGDVRDFSRLKLAFYGHGHPRGGAQAGGCDRERSPRNLVKTNVLGAANVLQAALAE